MANDKKTEKATPPIEKKPDFSNKGDDPKKNPSSANTPTDNGEDAVSKPSYDRGDPAQNPAVAGAGASGAEAADWPHQGGRLPKKDEKSYVDDSTPPQSASRIGGGTQDPSKH